MTDLLVRDAAARAALSYGDRDLALEGVAFLPWAEMTIRLALADSGLDSRGAVDDFRRAHALGECGDRLCPCVGLAGCALCEAVDGPGADCACERGVPVR